MSSFEEIKPLIKPAPEQVTPKNVYQVSPNGDINTLLISAGDDGTDTGQQQQAQLQQTLHIARGFKKKQKRQTGADRSLEDILAEDE